MYVSAHTNTYIYICVKVISMYQMHTCNWLVSIFHIITVPKKASQLIKQINWPSLCVVHLTILKFGDLDNEHNLAKVDLP